MLTSLLTRVQLRFRPRVLTIKYRGVPAPKAINTYCTWILKGVLNGDPAV